MLVNITQTTATMADDLDALFGAFDGEEEEDNNNNESVAVADNDKKSGDADQDDAQESDGESSTIEQVSKKRKTNVNDGDSDDEDMEESNNDKDKTKANNTDSLSNSGNKAKAVSTMYANVFSSMQHAVGHTQKQKKSTQKAGEKDGTLTSKEGGEGSNENNDDATKKSAATVDAAAEKHEVSTGTSHDKSIRSYSALPEGPSLKTPTATKDSEEEAVAKNRPPAKTYPFTLDPFQQTAIGYVERNESVLVAAHTSAGKTVVAEYAIAKSLRDGQRVVYTSPIKALSNQKYRDLQEEFDDVGLMTGDITINPSATCLVMTTEILRSMLYRGSEVMREVAWVIYDEVHYMRDKERGVVWEESIILLPHKVRFVFLSATIPNARQFVSWIAKIHHQPCHVVYTNYRPTPLQHYIFPQGGMGCIWWWMRRESFGRVTFRSVCRRCRVEGVRMVLLRRP